MAIFNQSATETFPAHSAADASIQERLVFLKKVYGLLTLSIITAAVGAYFGRNLSPSLFWPLVIAEFALIFFAFAVRRKAGWNLFALFAFTTVSGLTLGPVMTLYTGDSIQEALVLTALVFGGLTGYVMVSKKDFSFLSGFLIVGLIAVLVGGLLNAFLFQNPGFEFVLSVGGVILFSGFILYDTSNILRNYDVEDYTAATLALYLDVLNLFLFLLRLVGDRE